MLHATTPDPIDAIADEFDAATNDRLLAADLAAAGVRAFTVLSNFQVDDLRDLGVRFAGYDLRKVIQ